MEFEAVIGLELHAQINTKSKMFSSAPVSFALTPNSSTDLLDFAFPGSLPTVNKEAVIATIKMCHALNMEIDDTLIFERKNYFYSDLSKGYQITQQFRPIGKNGYLTIKLNNETKLIGITRLHLEEDTCKQLHTSDVSLLDYNRSGIPLLEIVSKPDIKNGAEAVKYVEKMRSILSFLGVCDGKMEEGSLRVDINISLKHQESTSFGTKVEIKNLNSFSNIQKAIDYEIDRQSKLLESGNKIKQETRRYDEKQKKTVPMRIKLNSIDYKFFTDPNIPPIRLSSDFINAAIASSSELAESKKQRYMSLGINEISSNILTSEVNLSNYFDNCLRFGCSPILLSNWVITDVLSFLNKNNIEIKEFPIEEENLANLVLLIDEGKISGKQAKVLFNKMIETKKDVKILISDMGLSQENDINVLLGIISEVLNNNEQAIIDYKLGKDRAVGYLIGQVMKLTNGNANPTLVNKLIVEELKRR